MRCYNRRAAPVAHRVWWGVGKTKGYPIYFPLAVHERIVSAWVCGCGSTFTDVGTGPYLLVSLLRRGRFSAPDPPIFFLAVLP